MLTAFDVLDICAVMLQRSGLGADDLAAHMRLGDLPSTAPAPAKVEAVAEEKSTPKTNVRKHEAKPMPKRRPTPTAKQNITINPKTVAMKTDGEVDYSRAKHTVAPTPAATAPHQLLVLPPDPRWPSFSATKLGVNPDTGKAWGAGG